MRVSVLWLVGVNLVPLGGVFFLGWEVSAILLLYWAENVVVGVFNIFKMKKARGTTVASRVTLNKRSIRNMKRASVISFFLFHYGMFTLIHGIFVVVMFGIPEEAVTWIWLPLLLMFVSHGVSYFTNFIGKGEYLRVSTQDLFLQPYSRVVVMHITIIFGGFLVRALGSPPAALMVMVAVKTGIDIFAHLKERKKHFATGRNGFEK